jgi:hypothetical protein
MHPDRDSVFVVDGISTGMNYSLCPVRPHYADVTIDWLLSLEGVFESLLNSGAVVRVNQLKECLMGGLSLLQVKAAESK